ncbi:MAG: glycosyltransferase family 2 protein [Anaerolineae bacterium]
MNDSRTQPTLSIIIVSWNVANLLMSCLRSIAATCPAETEVIVVDSASSDDTLSRVCVEFPNVTLLPQSTNVGFTRGTNIGLAASRGKYLMLLNPDTELLDGAAEAMISALQDDILVGIVGPRTLNPDGSDQSTRRRFPTFRIAMFESTWLQLYAPRQLLDTYTVRDVADDGTAPVDWVQGSCLLARREVYATIGGLDEGFVMYSEELDWCHRAKDAGWGVLYLGSARIIHYGGQSSAQVPARTHILFNQSKLRYMRKYHGRATAEVLRMILILNFAVQLILEATKGLLGHKRELRRQRVSVYWQVLRSGLKVS